MKDRREGRPLTVVRSTEVAEEGELANVPGNYYSKHQSSNPAVQFLMNRFHRAILEQVRRSRANSILDVGCGEGHTTREIAAATAVHVAGIDLELEAVGQARRLYPHLRFLSGSVYELPFRDAAFDLVVATEVLEHLDSPSNALCELRRVSRRWCLVSVPHEPWWRIANLARGAYWSALGNTPGHVQHWGRRGLRMLLRETFNEVEVRSTAMWSIALCRD